ncbi:hypothetical protein ES703_121220 [subsurface metagenome]
MTHAIGHRRPGTDASGRGHDVDQYPQRRRQRDAAAEQNAEVAAEQRRAMKLEYRGDDRQARELRHDAGAHCGTPPKQQSRRNRGDDERSQLGTVVSQQIGQRKEEFDKRIRFRVEVAQDRRELRQHKHDEKDQDRACRQENEGRIVECIGHLAAQRFGTRALKAKGLQNLIERPGHLADFDQCLVHRRKQRGMVCNRVGQAVSRQDRGPDFPDHRPQPPDVRVGNKQFESIIQPGAGLEQQSQVAREDRHILRPRARQ